MIFLRMKGEIEREMIKITLPTFSTLIQHDDKESKIFDINLRVILNKKNFPTTFFHSPREKKKIFSLKI